MTVNWLTAFFDLPAASFSVGATFWKAVTGSSLSENRGRNSEFATLVPPSGDAFLRVQRVVDGPGGIHVDLHSTDVAETVASATALGASLVGEPGHVIMSSPGGLTFCVVGYHGESIRPIPFEPVAGAPCLVDQMAIDVPADVFDRERTFWSALTGWAVHTGSRTEFAVLTRPSGMPLRLLLQRLGPDDGRTSSSAHLDLACGSAVDELEALHRSLGAEIVRREQFWTTLRDPAGFEYCLTRRDPVSGLLEL